MKRREAIQGTAALILFLFAVLFDFSFISQWSARLPHESWRLLWHIARIREIMGALAVLNIIGLVSLRAVRRKLQIL